MGEFERQAQGQIKTQQGVGTSPAAPAKSSISPALIAVGGGLAVVGVLLSRRLQEG